MFYFSLDPPIKLTNILPNDPNYDLIIQIPDSQSFKVQKALLSEHSKYFQQLSLIKNLKSIELTVQNDQLEKMIRLMYGETIMIKINELNKLELMMDFLDCKKAKDILKITLKSAVSKEDFFFLFTVFDFFAIRDHKKFCKDSMRKLFDLDFFEKLVLLAEINEENLKRTIEFDFNEFLSKKNDVLIYFNEKYHESINFLFLLKLLCEKSFLKFLVLLYQDILKKKGEKSKNLLISQSQEIIKIYYKYIQKKNDDKFHGFIQEFYLEINPQEKKFFETDIIQKLMQEVTQLKKSNINLNNQIQILKSKENEMKGKIHFIGKKIEKFDDIYYDKNNSLKHINSNSTEKISDKNSDNVFYKKNEKKEKIEKNENNEKIENLEKNEKIEKNEKNKKNEKILEKKENEEIIHAGGHGKFDGFLAYNEESKKNLKKTGFQKKKDVQNFPPPKKLNQEVKKFQENEEKQKKKISVRDYYQNDENKQIFYAYFCALLKCEWVTFKNIWESEKNEFKLSSLCQKLIESGPKILLIRMVDCEKVIGVYFSSTIQNLKPNYSDAYVFIFCMEPFVVLAMKEEFINKDFFSFTNEELQFGNDLILRDLSNIKTNEFNFPYYFFNEKFRDRESLGLPKEFLIKEMNLFLLSKSKEKRL